MRVEDLRGVAAGMGLKNIRKLKKPDLIRAIQQAEGNNPCFGAAWRMECREEGCCWRSDCRRN